jgi:hypothetical protein
MNNFRNIIRESFYNTEKNCVLEFGYPPLKQTDIESMSKKFSDLLKQINVEYSTNYANVSKIMVICKADKVDDVKSIAKSLGLVVQNELLPDPRESSHL